VCGELFVRERSRQQPPGASGFGTAGILQERERHAVLELFHQEHRSPQRNQEQRPEDYLGQPGEGRPGQPAHLSDQGLHLDASDPGVSKRDRLAHTLPAAHERGLAKELTSR
jgi:hypothetical protein